MWRRDLQRSKLQIPYYLIACAPSTLLVDMKVSGYPWRALIQVRSLLRIKCGAVCLSGLAGRASDARLQECVFCGSLVRNRLKHCICSCSRWYHWREQFQALGSISSASSPDFLVLSFLRCFFVDPYFTVFIAWAFEIDCAAVSFWRDHGVDHMA